MTAGMRWILAFGWMALVAAPSASQADLLRCVGPDGKMIFTDNKALCPAAKPFEPKGEVQIGESTSERRKRNEEAGPAASDREGLAERLRRAQERQAAFEAQEGEAQRWKKKQEKLEADIEALAKKRAHLEKFITNCNRGGLVYARDDAGIKRTVKCTDIKAQYAALGDDEERAHAALAALPEECRKAGCLPGWLR